MPAALLARRDLLLAQAAPAPPPPQPPPARYYGFNLQEKFTHSPAEWKTVAPEWGRANEPFRESDFALIAELGFNFVRLPMSYLCWVRHPRDTAFHEPTLAQIDQAVEWGRQYGIHVCLNFHRAPGYCINSHLLGEPFNLWTDSDALDHCSRHWANFAARYRGVPGGRLSFNLLNEPSRCTLDQYVGVARALAAAVRQVDPGRPLVFDGLFGEAMLPALDLCPIPDSLHSTRGYAPFGLSHYRAPWAGSPARLPAWPFAERRPPANTPVVWDRAQLHRWCIAPFLPVEKAGGTVMVGEWGSWNRTPHAVALAWMRDFLSLWREANWGWALWCFRGSFGILDSGRADVKYERWKGHLLDRRMLELLIEGRGAGNIRPAAGV